MSWLSHSFCKSAGCCFPWPEIIHKSAATAQRYSQECYGTRLLARVPWLKVTRESAMVKSYSRVSWLKVTLKSAMVKSYSRVSWLKVTLKSAMVKSYSHSLD